MISEKDLQEAIAECKGVRNPSANTCMKLAAYYTIKDHLFGDEQISTQTTPKNIPSYSFADEPVNYIGESEFSQIIKGKNINDVLAVIDELMDTLNMINPRLYEGVMTKLLQ